MALAPRLKAAGIAISGVRLDSGDLADHVAKGAAHLRRRGLAGVNHDLGLGRAGRGGPAGDLLAAGAPIDGYGVGTSLDHLRRCAGPRLRLQAPGICGPGAAQALGGQGDLARPQTGLSPERPERTNRRGSPHAGERSAGGGSASAAGDACGAAARPVFPRSPERAAAPPPNWPAFRSRCVGWRKRPLIG
ncbi:MAG: hypothetical protein MPW15_24975 [Candidatus Manganitrophus sp.]|nr:hypothetical protein [Candidatus Manganitrophus sp.]